METCLRAVAQATAWLNTQKSPRILACQIRNLGDTLELGPILHHYRIKYPQAAIAFVVGQWYHNAHEYNPHINKLFLGDHNASPQQVLKLWDPVKKAKGIDIKLIPAVFPFGEVHIENKWSLGNIADQYLHNAGITDLKPLGGRKLIVRTDGNDTRFANKMFEKHKIDKLVVLEYVSYSRPPVWSFDQYVQFAVEMRKKGIQCLSICAAHEPAVPGTIECKGITWRQSAAILNRASAIIGCGSGITMLAAAADHVPKIIELDIPPSVNMAGCGFAPSISVSNPSVGQVKSIVLEQIK